MPSGSVLVSLSQTDLSRLLEALDAYAYWQLGDVLPRSDGEVFIPGDLAPGSDRYWDGVAITAEQRVAIDGIHACRALIERLLRAASDAGAEDQ